MKLTDTFVKRKQGNGNVQKHSDGGGLFLYITPTGKKSWRLAYRFAGKQKLLVIGPYPAISLKEARERRDAAKKLLVDNIDPSAAKQAAKVAAANAARDSFETVAREWVERNAAKWSDAYRLNILDRLERDIFGTLGKRPIKTITAPELLAVLRKIEERGAVETAHRGLSDCGRIFRYAIVTGRAERDVAADLRGALTRPQETHFATMTDPKDIGQILRDFDAYNGLTPVRYVLKLIPYFFVRSSELTKAEWSEFDMDKAEWRIPAERMKMRQIHIVPLARQPLAILRELHSFSGHTPYLFPGKGKLAPTVDSKSLIWALRKMGYTKDMMSIHGFRAMASTHLNEQGYNRDWIERQLAHSERNSIRAAYNYAEYLPERRKMMQDYADYLTALKERQ
ncbi:integrase arm-type DNA-binding domain-containing protein [Desulfovibrio sp. OttesenSCG-928-C14]|nr:integrase arm-type DNA-binding domain-containing protein [Desulfovibrio sp. OttesenSCG-928-C14]